MEQPLVALDSEWYNFELQRHRVGNGLAYCWTFCYRDRDGYLENIYLQNHGGDSADVAMELEPWFKDPNRHKITHGGSVDYHVLSNSGIVGKGFRYDTLVMD